MVDISLINRISVVFQIGEFKFAIEVKNNTEILKHTVNNNTECVGF